MAFFLHKRLCHWEQLEKKGLQKGLWLHNSKWEKSSTYRNSSMHQKHYPTLQNGFLKKSRERVLKTVFKLQKFLFSSKATHAYHIQVYNSTCKSKKSFGTNMACLKKNFSIFKDWYRETIFIGNEVKSSIFQLRVHAVLLSHHLLVLKSIIHQSLSCIPNSLILVEKKPLGRSNTLKRKLVCNAFPLVHHQGETSYDIWLRCRNTLVVPMTVVTIFTLPLLSCLAMLFLLSFLSSPTTSGDNKKGMQNGSSRKGQSKKCHVQLVMDNNSPTVGTKKKMSKSIV